MLQREHSAILSTFIILPFVINIFVWSIFEWRLKTGFTLCAFIRLNKVCPFSFSVVLAISSLMVCPNADNPAVQEIADMYIKDREKFEATARQYTEEHAKPFEPGQILQQKST